MADGEYRRLAHACGASGCADAGRLIKGLCTRHYRQLRTHGAVGPREQRCAQCGLGFTAQRKRMYCGDKCAGTAANRRLGIRPLDEYKAAVRNEAHYFKCEWCSKDAWRCLGGKNKARGSGNRWCSMACKKEQAAAERVRRQESESALRARRDALRRISAALRHLSRAKTKADALPRLACSLGCEVCGRRFEFMAGKQGRPPRLCSKGCARRTPAARRCKAAAKMRRRGAVVERFDPLSIFERDGWRCQMCGVSTPRSRRGTMHHNAPELDHIVPIAKGGEHSVRNVQTACRSCNGWKGARVVVGQIGLFASG